LLYLAIPETNGTEKQKLLRIIKRVKRSLTEEEEGSKAQKKLIKELKEARIMLNYVRHYP
jgi:hypothetical protein